MLGLMTDITEILARLEQGDAKAAENLLPLVTYYLSRHKPHAFIRIEIPKFMWDRSNDNVKKALQMVAWQHELGHSAPLVQLHADERCNLSEEIKVIFNQISVSFRRANIEFLEDYQ